MDDQEHRIEQEATRAAALVDVASIVDGLRKRGSFSSMDGESEGDRALARIGEQLEASIVRLTRNADAAFELLTAELGSSLETVIGAVERYDFRSGGWMAFLRKRLQWMVLHERTRASRR
jgi:hypothetical protein